MSITTMPQRTKDQLAIDMLIASGAVKVTRCPDAAWQTDSCIRFKNGHMLPSHLNPVTLS